MRDGLGGCIHEQSKARLNGLSVVVQRQNVSLCVSIMSRRVCIPRLWSVDGHGLCCRLNKWQVPRLPSCSRPVKRRCLLVNVESGEAARVRTPSVIPPRGPLRINREPWISHALSTRRQGSVHKESEKLQCKMWCMRTLCCEGEQTQGRT